MCQKACLPAPNTARFLSRVLRDRRSEEARAVRNAVISSALRNPIGRPSFDMIVRAPRGVVSAFESIVDIEVAEGATSVTTISCISEGFGALQPLILAFHPDATRTRTWHEQCREAILLHHSTFWLIGRAAAFSLCTRRILVQRLPQRILQSLDIFKCKVFKKLFHICIRQDCERHG